MMELTICAFIVTVVSLVTATPYGYGVKSGAGARADSSAVAGAFGGRGDIPVVPFGNGFSGSFSKSSSSSSTSSSASSSSSSSSFSYSGSGAGAFSGSDGKAGCTYGSCSNSGANEISGNHGSNAVGTGLHGYNGANAGAIAGSSAAAGSGAISGGNCQGSTCDNNSGKCSSGQCSNKLQSGTSLAPHDSNTKCNSGLCGSPLPEGPSASQYDSSDDIKILGHSSNSAHDSKDLSSNYDKTTGNTDASDCHGDNCGPSTTVNSPSTFSPYSYHNTNPLNNQQPPKSNSAVIPGYTSPATYLEAPKLSSNCNSGSCNYDQSEPSYGSLPSSYNVPIHGSYDTKQQPLCADGKCEYPQKGSYSSTTSNSLSTNYLIPQNSPSTKGPLSKYPTSNCAGSDCGLKPFSTPGTLTPSVCRTPNCNPYFSASAPNGANEQPENIGYPEAANKVTSGLSPTGPSETYNNKPTFPSASTGCYSPDCSGHVSSPGANPLSTYNYIKPSVSDKNQPIYTGGFGAPAGMLKPNEFTAPPSSKPVQSAIPTYNAPSTVTTGCNTPNCIGSSPSPGDTTTAQFGSYGIHKESGGVTYTGSFGGPTGMLEPNNFDTKVPSIPSYNSQPSSSSTSGCKTPNCKPPVAATTTGSYSATKPNVGVDSSSELPPYTGGFGGPAGFLKPNEFNSAHPISNNPYSGASPHKTPTSNVAGCKTPNCSPPVATSLNPQASFVTPKPPFDSSITFPGYTSNYRPIGITNPSASPVAPITTSYTPLHPTGTYSSGCKTGNCGGYPTGGAEGKFPSGSYDTSTECKTGNCAAYPATGHDVNAPSANQNTAPKPSVPYGSTAGCKAGNCDIYPTSESSVNGPSGSHPAECKTGNCAAYPTIGNDVKIPSGLQGNSGDCKTGNCGVYPTGESNVNAPSGTYGVTNPNTATQSSGSYGNAPGCKTGSCANYPVSGSNVHPSPTSHVTNSNTASKPYNPEYTGAFGGPYGTVKPSDHVLNGPSDGGCKTSNCANQTPANAGTVAQSASYAGSKQPLPAYTGGFGAPSGLLKPNEYSGPSVTPTLNKPSSIVSPAVTCISGNCNPNVPSSPGHDTALSGAHASAASSTSANAVIYTGGFGGPPGFLKPYDDGKVDLAKLVSGQYQGSQYGGGDINFPRDAKAGVHESGTVASPTNTGALGHSAGGATAFSGSVASAKSGSYGYNHGAHQAGTGGCGGGCGGGHQDSGSSAIAGAKSLSSAGAYGGSFASSSASAHSSAGAYTKGGYGKR